MPRPLLAAALAVTVTAGSLSASPARAADVAGAAEVGDLAEQARALFAAGDRDAAYPLLTALVDRPDAPRWAYLYKATTERERGEVASAADTLGRVWDPSRADRDVGLELAATVSWLDRIDEARAIYERLLALDPDDVDAAVGRGRMLRWSGRPAAARRELERVLAAHPDHPAALAELAAAQIDDVRHGAARESLARLAEVDADHPELDVLDARLEASVRWTVAAEAGAIVDADVSPLVAARFDGRFVRAVGLYGEWARRGLRPAEAADAVDSAAHVARAGLRGEVGRGAGWSAGGRAIVAPSTTQVMAELGGSYRFRIPLGVAVTARAGAEANGAALVGGDATVSGSPGRGWTMLGQTFVTARVPSAASPTSATPAGPGVDVAVLGGIDRALGRRLTVGARGGWATNRAGNFGLATGSVRVQAHRNLAVTGRYELVAGPFVRHTIVAGLEARW